MRNVGPAELLLQQTIVGLSSEGVQKVSHTLYDLYASKEAGWKQSALQVDRLIIGWLMTQSHNEVQPEMEKSLNELRSLVTTMSNHTPLHPILTLKTADAIAKWVADATDLQIFEAVRLCSERPCQRWRLDALYALLTQEQTSFVETLASLHMLDVNRDLIPQINESVLGSTGNLSQSLQLWCEFLRKAWVASKDSETELPILQDAIKDLPEKFHYVLRLIQLINGKDLMFQLDINALLNISEAIRNKNIKQIVETKRRKEREAVAKKERERLAAIARKEAQEKRVQNHISLLRRFNRLQNSHDLAIFIPRCSDDQVVDLVHFCLKVEDPSTQWRLSTLLEKVPFSTFHQIILSLDPEKRIDFERVGKAMMKIADQNQDWVILIVGRSETLLNDSKLEIKELFNKCTRVSPDDITPKLLDRIGQVRSQLIQLEETFSKLQLIAKDHVVFHQYFTHLLKGAKQAIAQLESDQSNPLDLLQSKTHGFTPSPDQDFFFGRLGRWGFYHIEDLHDIGLLPKSISLRTHNLAAVWKSAKNALSILGIESEKDLADRQIFNRATLIHYIASRQDFLC